jgi:hypothetical protein
MFATVRKTMTWWIPVVGLLIIGGIVAILLLSRKKEPSLASRLGLSDQGGVLRGQVQGFSVSVETQIGGEIRKRSRTVVKIEFPQRLGLGLKIMNPLGGRRSLRALSTGDAGFDESVTVEAQDQKKTLDYLTPQRRQCIQKMLASEPGAWVDDLGITCTQERAVTEFEPLKQIIDDLLDAAIEIFPGRAARKAVREAEKGRRV